MRPFAPCVRSILWMAIAFMMGGITVFILYRPEYLPGGIPPFFLTVFLGFLLFLTAALFCGKRRHYVQRCTALEAKNDRYNRAIKAARLGFWEWDIEQGTMLWDGCTADIYGLESNEQLGHSEKPVLDMIASDHESGASREWCLQRLENGLVIDGDYKINFPGGRDIWAHVQGKVDRWKDGKPVAMSGIITDATNRKKNEIELLRSNEELERFAYVASHDLKAPLRAINNLVQWVIDDTADIIPQASRDNLDLLTDRVARMSALLEDILTYSRAGRMVDNASPVDTQSLIQTLADTIVPPSFTVTLADGMPVLLSQRTQLEQVFSNLLSNAVKHHDSTTGTITISAKESGQYYEFCVRDDGPGIAPAYHNRVFEMFQTLQSKDRVDGSGLGLAIVKKIVDWKGGNIWIESENNRRGTAIHFLWPKE